MRGRNSFSGAAAVVALVQHTIARATADAIATCLLAEAGVKAVIARMLVPEQGEHLEFQGEGDRRSRRSCKCSQCGAAFVAQIKRRRCSVGWLVSLTGQSDGPMTEGDVLAMA